MARIRTYNFLDKVKLKKIASHLDYSIEDQEGICLPPFIFRFLHWALPVSLKFLPEGFTAVEDKDIAGVIVLKPNIGNWKKWKITKLILAQNAQMRGQQLVEYAVSHYGSYGVSTFIVNVEISQQNVIDFFSKSCGFKSCSFEQLWKLKGVKLREDSMFDYNIRSFKNSDAQIVCDLYNNSIYSQFRKYLSKSKFEFFERPFQGLEKTVSYKYVVENNISKVISGYIVIKTSDNKNFLLEMSLDDFHNENFSELIAFATNQICRRVSNFNLYIINKKYKQNSSALEEYLTSMDSELKKTEAVMVKDYYSTVMQEEQSFSPAIIFTNLKGTQVYNNK